MGYWQYIPNCLQETNLEEDIHLENDGRFVFKNYCDLQLLWRCRAFPQKLVLTNDPTIPPLPTYTDEIIRQMCKDICVRIN